MFLLLYCLFWHVNRGKPFRRFQLCPAMHQVNFIMLIHSASAQLQWMGGCEWMDEWRAECSSERTLTLGLDLI